MGFYVCHAIANMMPPLKLRTGLLFLVMIGILVWIWGSIHHAWATNSAFVDLSHAILRSDDEAATRFEIWAYNIRSARERDAAVGGMLMLMAREGREMPKAWLQEWISSHSRLMEGTSREQVALFALSALSTSDQETLVSDLDASTAAWWLVTVAMRRPEKASFFVKVIDDKGLVSALPPEDRVGLATVYGNLALESYRRGSAEEAMALVNRSLDLDSQNEMGMIVKAIMLIYQGQLEAGLVLLEQATALYPRSVFAWEVLASRYLTARSFQAAERAARKAISLGPPDSWVQSLLAATLLRQGRCAEALPYAQPPVKNVPDAPNYLLILGDVYWCLGDREEAVAVYQHLEAIAPGYAPYIRERIRGRFIFPDK